jgi:ferric-dicitrate binding protein FerR (iron transport regulator)
MNVLEIPRGGKFKLTLADGTKVWMNSASSLTYPTSFKKGADRIIALSGEAYFEVAKNKSMPFKVLVNDMEVKVTGTHFNINAYADEDDIRTTLLEGGVEVTRNDKTRILTPGQQATVKRSANTLNVNAANLTQVVAWKDGLFIFDEKEVTEILREISRWYDVEFEYNTSPGKATYSGVINRNLSLDELLDVLKESRVLNYRLVGRKVIILPL